MKTIITYLLSNLATISLLVTNIQIYALNYNFSFTASGVTTSVGSVQVQNLTKSTTVTVPEGNTLSLIDVTALDELNANNDNIQISQDASTGKSLLTFYAKQTGSTQVDVYTIDVRKAVTKTTNLELGYNTIELSLPTGMFAIQISGKGYSYSTKLRSHANAAVQAEIKFQKNEKIDASAPQMSKKTETSAINMGYSAGDQLLFTATSGTFIASVPDVPIASKTINFVFFAISTTFIPTGTFLMGSPATEVNRISDETQHSVTLNTFHMSKYEITNAQYAAFLNAKSIGSNGLYAAGAYPNEVFIYASSGSFDFGLHYSNSQWVPVAGYETAPVIHVTWFGSKEFANYVGGTLPTEAQWEYACRAGTITPFNTGIFLTNLQANYDWQYPYNGGTNTVTTYSVKTNTVGSYAANAYGLYDMHGNIMEWCADWYGTYPTTVQTDPTGPTTGLYQLIRGGCWSNYAKDCRSAYRAYNYPNGYGHDIGFRIVMIP